MATRFVNIDRDTPLLLPPDLRDWVPADHLAHFILDAVEELDLRQVKVNSYERAGQMIAQLEEEVQQLLAKAEQADATPLQDGLTIPGEIVRRGERKAALEKARTAIEARAKARCAAELAEHEKKMAAREPRGEKPRGPVPTPPSPEPKPKDEDNFTDPESRIMKSGGNFEQCYYAQAVVEVEIRLIVGARVSQSANDKQELVSTLATIPTEAGAVARVLADSGFFSEAAVKQVERTADGAVSEDKNTKFR